MSKTPIKYADAADTDSLSKETELLRLDAMVEVDYPPPHKDFSRHVSALGASDQNVIVMPVEPEPPLGIPLDGAVGFQILVRGSGGDLVRYWKVGGPSVREKFIAELRTPRLKRAPSYIVHDPVAKWPQGTSAEWEQRIVVVMSIIWPDMPALADMLRRVDSAPIKRDARSQR